MNNYQYNLQRAPKWPSIICLLILIMLGTYSSCQGQTPITDLYIDVRGYDLEFNWSTYREKDVSHFVIEFSRDGIYWMDQYRISAVGNSNYTERYFKRISMPILRRFYYRIRIVYISGREQYTSYIDCQYMDGRYR